MDKELISLLKSSDPDDRIDGINRLVDGDHPDAQRILGALYKKETDPSVKQVAKEAAKRLQAAKSTPSEAAVAAAKTIRRDPQAAKEYLESAMTALIAFRNDDAWEMAAKAFRADPELAEDDYATGLAGEITGADRQEAVQQLLAGAPVSEQEEEKPKRKPKNDDDFDGDDFEDERVGWGKALAGIGVYALLIAIVAALPFFVFSSLISAIALAFDPGATAEAAVATSLISSIGIAVAVGSLIFVPIGIMIQYGLIHFSAKTFLGGKGYYTNLLWNIRVPLIAQFIVQVVLFIIMGSLLFSSFANIDPSTVEAVANTGDPTMIPGVEQNLNILNILNGLNGLIGLAFTVWISIVIGKTYNFGGVKGCLSIIISSIVMVVAICGCYFVIIVGVLGAVGGNA